MGKPNGGMGRKPKAYLPPPLSQLEYAKHNTPGNYAPNANARNRNAGQPIPFGCLAHCSQAPSHRRPHRPCPPPPRPGPPENHSMSGQSNGSWESDTDRRPDLSSQGTRKQIKGRREKESPGLKLNISREFSFTHSFMCSHSPTAEVRARHVRAAAATKECHPPLPSPPLPLQPTPGAALAGALLLRHPPQRD